MADTSLSLTRCSWYLCLLTAGHRSLLACNCTAGAGSAGLAVSADRLARADSVGLARIAFVHKNPVGSLVYCMFLPAGIDFRSFGEAAADKAVVAGKEPAVDTLAGRRSVVCHKFPPEQVGSLSFPEIGCSWVVRSRSSHQTRPRRSGFRRPEPGRSSSGNDFRRSLCSLHSFYSSF